jgi:putative endonuclease
MIGTQAYNRSLGTAPITNFNQLQQGDIMYYVYLLQEIGRGRHYIGYTNNLERRLTEHNLEHNGFTGKGQWSLVYFEAYLSKEDAQEREKKLKQDGRSRRYVMERSKLSQYKLKETITS